MPVTLTIDREQRVVYSGFLGVVTEEDFVSQIGKILAHPLFDPSFADMIDFSSTTELNLSDSMLEASAKRKSVFSLDALHVLIAPRGLIHQLSKRFQEWAQSTRPNMMVVHTRSQAYDCLREYEAKRKKGKSAEA